MSDNFVSLLLILGLAYFLFGRQRAVKPLENEETWTWSDYKGHQYEIMVHRKVK